MNHNSISIVVINTDSHERFKQGRKIIITVLQDTHPLKTSVADPDQYVFGPPGSTSGSVSQRYGYEDAEP
jgi:hypothetical protein